MTLEQLKTATIDEISALTADEANELLKCFCLTNEIVSIEGSEGLTTQEALIHARESNRRASKTRALIFSSRQHKSRMKQFCSPSSL